MQENTIFVKKYLSDKEVLPVNYNEVWRYAGYIGKSKEVDSSLDQLLSEVLEELKNQFAYKVCYRRVPISWEGEMPVLPFESQSKNLAKCLQGAEEIVMFAATVGLPIDRMIARYQRLSPAKALMMQAYGAERIEALCNTFCKEIAREVEAENKSCTARYSPGYGDLPLETQRDFFALLDCNRQVGIALNESLLMTPSKSVTAIFGIKKGTSVCGQSEGHKCSQCDNTNCEYRK